MKLEDQQRVADIYIRQACNRYKWRYTEDLVQTVIMEVWIKEKNSEEVNGRIIRTMCYRSVADDMRKAIGRLGKRVLQLNNHDCDYLPAKDTNEPLIISDYLDWIESNMVGFERVVFHMLRHGKTKYEIGKELGADYQTVWATVKKIKAKALRLAANDQ